VFSTEAYTDSSSEGTAFSRVYEKPGKGGFHASVQLGAMEAVVWLPVGLPGADRSLRRGARQTQSHKKGVLRAPEG
jgi:hypothetical protein